MKEVHTVLKCMTEQSADLLVLEENTETAVLDTGCARSTSGRQWIEAHIRSLSQGDRSEVRRKEGKAYFKFGTGRIYKSKELVILPVYFGSRKAIMAVDIVDIKIPLLISLAAMKKAGTIIYTGVDIATICGEHIKLGREGGYYTTSVRKDEAEVMQN